MASAPRQRRTIRVDYFDPEADGPRSGELSFRRDHALVQFAGGGQVTLPYKGAQVGHSAAHPHPILVMITGDRSFVRLYVQDGDYAAKLGAELPRGLRAELESAARSARWRRVRMPAVAAALAGLVVGGWFGALWAFDRAVDAVPPQWEVEFGQAAVSSVINGEQCDDPLVEGAVNEIANRLIGALPKSQPYPFHVQVIWNEQENAFALPGGEIVVHSGLVAAAETPDEVAGILGHEIQHVLGRHSFRRMANEMGMSLVLAVVLGDNGVLARLASGGAGLLNLKFDRSQESESDRIGMRLAYDAGYRPEALGDFFRRQMAQRPVDETTGKLLAYLSTHPADAERLEQIRRLAADLPDIPPPGEDSLAQWQRVRERARTIPAKRSDAPAEKGNGH